MQQLLREDASGTDGTLLRKMFLQQLPVICVWLRHQETEILLRNFTQLADGIITLCCWRHQPPTFRGGR